MTTGRGEDVRNDEPRGPGPHPAAVLDWDRVAKGEEPAPDRKAEMDAVHARLRHERRYFDAPKVKASEVAPPEDGALSGWRFAGLRCMTRGLWPRDVDTNVIIAYYLNRRRWAWVETVLILSCYAIAAGITLWMYWAVNQRFFAARAMWEVGLLAALFMGVLAPVACAAVTGWTIRRTLTALPLEELRLTRLVPADIVQGLALGPMTAHSFGLGVYTLVELGGMIVAFLALPIDTVAAAYAIIFYALLFALPRWRMTQSALEAGGAFAVRAQFCMKRWSVAASRTALDLSLYMTVVMLATLVCLLPAAVLAAVLPWLFGAIMPMAGGLGFAHADFVVTLALVLAFWPALTILRGAAHEALSWTYEHVAEWWPFFDAETAGDDRQIRRTIFTPWKPLVGERVPWTAGPPSPPPRAKR